MLRTEEGWKNQFRYKDALWIHDGNPKRPHPLLTSGRHSNGFCNCRPIIADELMLRDCVSDLFDNFIQERVTISGIQGIVGPQTGATKLAELISGEMTGFDGRDRFWASPAKHEEDGVKSMVFTDGERELLQGKTILLCEDVVSTSGSVDLTANAVLDAGGTVLPFVLALVNRSGLTEVGGRKVVALITHAMPMWDAGDCPLCVQGSDAIRPKDGENWKRLNAEY